MATRTLQSPVAHVFGDVPAFVAVVEAGGFSAAARQLNLSRSAIGKTIARLEARLDVRLFQRTTRTITLTDDGQAFYDRCRRAVDEVAAGAMLLDAGRDRVTGTLKVSMPVVFGRMRVVPVLLKLAGDHPGLALDLDFRDRHVDLLGSGIDLAVRNGTVGTGNGLMARLLTKKRKIVCASPDYLARHGPLAGPAAINGHSTIAYSRDGRVQAWRFPGTGAGPIEIAPAARYRFDDLGAILDAVRAGVGIAWLPDWLVATPLRDGVLVDMLPGEPSNVEDISVIWPETPHLPARVRAAIDALAASFDRR